MTPSEKEPSPKPSEETSTSKFELLYPKLSDDQWRSVLRQVKRLVEESRPRSEPELNQPYWVTQAFQGMSKEEWSQLEGIVMEDNIGHVGVGGVRMVIDSLEERPPSWFPDKWNGRPLSAEERLRWFDENFDSFRSSLVSADPSTDLDELRRETIYCLCSLYQVMQMDELDEPSFTP
jgi:hypothetical protein